MSTLLNKTIITTTAAACLQLSASPALAADQGLHGSGDPAFDGVYRQSVSMMAPAAADRQMPASAITRLKKQQCADGSFMAYRTTTSACVAPDPLNLSGEDTDSATLAAAALWATGNKRPARRAVTWLANHQNTDVGWAHYPADAATTYRFWSYWTGGQQWTYSSKGPAFRVPPSDSVEGWHFVVSPDSGSASTPPSTASDYAELCPGQPAAPSGMKRVAVVIDFGPAGIAPSGDTPPADIIECLTAAESANGLQVLQRVAELRFHTSGLICGIAGYPSKECPGQSPASEDRKTSAPAPTPETGLTPAGPPASPGLPPSDQANPDAEPGRSESPSTPATDPASSAPSQAVAVEIPAGPDAPTSAGTQIPAWVAAVGAAMIAVLLALAFLMRRGRE